MKNLKALTLVLCVSTAIGIAHPAMAQDADDFAAKLSAAYGAAGYTLAFGPSTVDGDTYTYKGVTLTLPAYADAAAEPIKIDTDLTFTGVAEDDDGSYTAESLTVPDINFEQDGVKITAVNLSLDNIYVPADAEQGIAGIMQLFAGGTAGPITVSNAGKEVFSIASIEATSEFAPEQGTDALESVKANVAFNGIKGDLSSITEAEPRAMIDALGINTFTGSLVETMDWTMADGRMNVSDVSLTLDNLGKIGFAFDITGYTPALFDSLLASQKELATVSEADRAAKEEALGMEMASKLSIGGLKVRYDDASLAGKLLDTFAKQQGADRAGFVSGLKMIIPAMLSQSPATKLNDQVTAAANTFLDDPKSIEIKAAPDAPVNFMALAAGAADPNSVVDLLKVTVTANQPAN